MTLKIKKILFTLLFLLGFFLFGKASSNPAFDKIKTDQDTITQRHFENNFKQKYTDEKFVYEFKAPERNAWDRFKEWLYELFRDLFNLTDKSKAINNIDIFVRILAVLLIIYVVYLIVKAIINKEGGWIFGKSNNSKIIEYEDVENNIHLVDFKKLISAAEKEGDVRLATRYYYLWLLKKMSEVSIIDWNPEKTNADYSYEIKNQTLKDKFNYLSYLYNYVWYGEFEIDNDTYKKTKQDFENTLMSLK